MLEIVHAGHMGVEKCLRRARDIMFWPHISSEISQLVLNCPICLEHRNSQIKEPLMPHAVPQYPWQVVGSDVFTLTGQNYLVVCDYYSNYFEIEKLSSTSSTVVIKHMKTWFSRHGIPEKVVSDGASYYSSQEFQDFITEWDILHVQSSPHYPQSNGLAGSCVKRAKMMLTKVKQTGQDPLIALLEYRTTALCTGYSPAEHLMGRKIRSFLPTPTNQFVPIAINHQEIRSQLEQQKNKQKKQIRYAFKGSKTA